MKRSRKIGSFRGAEPVDPPASAVRAVSYRQRFDWQWICRRVRARGIAAQDVEDVAQEVVIAMNDAEGRMVVAEGQSRDEVRRALLRTIVRRKVAGHVEVCVRRQRVEDGAAPEAHDVADAAPNAEELALVRADMLPMRAALAELEKTAGAQHAVFVAYELEELSMAEVAAKLGIRENTAWTRLRLARQVLQETLRRWAAQERFAG